MDKLKVVVIRCSEDGDKSIDVIREETFLEQLNKGYYGEKPVFAKPGEKIEMDYFVGMIVIKGEIVSPKPVDVVKKYEL